MKQSLKSGGFTPKEAVAATVVDVLIHLIKKPDVYAEHDKPAYKRAMRKAAHKLALKLMEQNKLDGVLPDPTGGE